MCIKITYFSTALRNISEFESEVQTQAFANISGKFTTLLSPLQNSQNSKS